MVDQRRKTYTKTTPMGHEVTVTEMTREDVEQELAEFEAKYGMSSEEFAARWNRGEMDCAVMDYFDWAGTAAIWRRCMALRIEDSAATFRGVED